jgi:hypothetical protein
MLDHTAKAGWFVIPCFTRRAAIVSARLHPQEDTTPRAFCFTNSVAAIVISVPQSHLTTQRDFLPFDPW